MKSLGDIKDLNHKNRFILACLDKIQFRVDLLKDRSQLAEKDSWGNLFKWENALMNRVFLWSSQFQTYETLRGGLLDLNHTRNSTYVTILHNVWYKSNTIFSYISGLNEGNHDSWQSSFNLQTEYAKATLFTVYAKSRRDVETPVQWWVCFLIFMLPKLWLPLSWWSEPSNVAISPVCCGVENLLTITPSHPVFP